MNQGNQWGSGSGSPLLKFCNMILHYWHNEIKELTPLLSINCFHLSEHHSY
jgi:hypothetical protein